MIEMIIFQPLSGEYDVARVEGFILDMPFTFRDPTDESGPYFLCGNAEMTGASRRQLLAEPDSGYPYVAMVRIKPAEIKIRQECEEDAGEQARALAEWIRAEYPSRIYNGYGTDLTEICRDSLAPLYEN